MFYRIFTVHKRTHKMSQKALIQQLKKREAELIEELEAIQVLIGAYDKEDEPGGESAQTTAAKIIHPKGAMGWEDYAVFLLEQAGGEAKSSAIGDMAVKGNPTLNSKTVQRAIKSKLSIAFREGRIDAEKSKYPKDGFLYKIKPKKMVRTKLTESSPE